MSEPTNAVFLSYASQDAEAAARLCGALRAGGIEVWFDQQELRRRGRFDEVLVHQTRAGEIDSLNERYSGNALITLLGLRRFPEAIELTKLQAVRFPNNPDSYFVRARLESILLKDDPHYDELLNHPPRL